MIFQKIENNNIGFYLTNFFPRKFLTSFFGRLSHSSNPFIVKGLLLLFRIFCGDLNLSESKEQNFKKSLKIILAFTTTFYAFLKVFFNFFPKLDLTKVLIKFPKTVFGNANLDLKKQFVLKNFLRML